LINQGTGFTLPTLNTLTSKPVTTTTTPSLSTTTKLTALQQYFNAATIKSHKLRQKDLKESVGKLASKLNEDYLKMCQIKPRPLALQLINLVTKMNESCEVDDMIGFEKSLIELKCKIDFLKEPFFKLYCASSNHQQK
jgi:hypothetical protein